MYFLRKISIAFCTVFLRFGSTVSSAVELNSNGNSSVYEGPTQEVYVHGNPSASVGQTIRIRVDYTVSDKDATLTGLGLNIHYDSSVLTFEDFSDVLSTDNINSGSGPFEDVDDTDGDSSTDTYISVAWASLFSRWPGALPKTLAVINFDVNENVGADATNTTIGFSSISNTVGYTFTSAPYVMPLLVDKCYL